MPQQRTTDKTMHMHVVQCRRSSHHASCCSKSCVGPAINPTTGFVATRSMETDHQQKVCNHMTLLLFMMLSVCQVVDSTHLTNATELRWLLHAQLAGPLLDLCAMVSAKCKKPGKHAEGDASLGMTFGCSAIFSVSYELCRRRCALCKHMFIHCKQQKIPQPAADGATRGDCFGLALYATIPCQCPPRFCTACNTRHATAPCRPCSVIMFVQSYWCATPCVLTVCAASSWRRCTMQLSHLLWPCIIAGEGQHHLQRNPVQGISFCLFKANSV